MSQFVFHFQITIMVSLTIIDKLLCYQIIKDEQHFITSLKLFMCLITVQFDKTASMY